MIYKYLPKMDGQLMQLADGDKGSQQALVLESGSHGDLPAKSVEPLYGRSLKILARHGLLTRLATEDRAEH